MAALTSGAPDGTPLLRRAYRDGVELSIIGMGGLVVSRLTQEKANYTVAESIERGVNYFDVAPVYGNAEERLGPALKPYRHSVFLACKTGKRDAEGARQELENSLRLLKADHFDLYQFHGIGSMDDVEQILAPGGAADLVLKARDQGKVRFVGFSTHSQEAAISFIDRFQCDSVLFPLNFVCFQQGNFGPRLLAHAKKKGVARLAIKALAYTCLPEAGERVRPKCWYHPVTDREPARQALRFALSEDITAAIPPGDESLYRMVVDLAADFSPLTAEEREELLAATEGVQPIFPQ